MKREDGTSQALQDKEPAQQVQAPDARRRSFKIQTIVAALMLLCIIIGGFLIVKSGSGSAPTTNSDSNAQPLPKPWCAAPSGLSTNFTGTNISGLAQNDVWSVGSQVTHWDGKGWNAVYTPANQQYTLRSIAEIAPNNVWAVGEQITNGPTSHPFIIHWDGSSWHTTSAPDATQGGKNSLVAVSGISPNDIWAAGFYVPQGPTGVLVEHWDGKSWSVVAPRDVPSGAQFTSIKAFASNDVWAVGYTSTSVSGQVINQPLAEHWNGSRWTNAATPNLSASQGGIIYNIGGISSTDLWMVGSLKNGNMLTEHWDGKSWSTIASPSVLPNTSNWLSGVAALAPNNVWAVGRVAVSNTQFQPYIEHWDGHQWVTIQDPTQGAGELDVITAVGNQYWIVGIPNSSGGHQFIETVCQ